MLRPPSALVLHLPLRVVPPPSLARLLLRLVGKPRALPHALPPGGVGVHMSSAPLCFVLRRPTSISKCLRVVERIGWQRSLRRSCPCSCLSMLYAFILSFAIEFDLISLHLICEFCFFSSIMMCLGPTRFMLSLVAGWAW